MTKSVINSYRLQPGPVQSPPTIAGRIVPVAAPSSYRRALVVLAALLLPLLAVGVVVYAARAVQPATVDLPPPGVVVRVVEATPVVIERVVEVQASPIIIIVTPTAPPARVIEAPRPVQAAPVVSQSAPMPTQRPRIQPTAPPPPVSGGPVRAAGIQAQPTPDAGPQERLLSRPCVYPSAPQGTVIRGYYTDASGVKRDAVCRADGWKAVQ